MPEQECRTERQEAASIDEVNDLIERTARQGAQRMLQAALEQEVKDHLERYAHFQTEEGRRQVVANGHAPERTILTGVGPLRLARPRVDERKARDAKEYERFSSRILPRFLRRTPTLEGALATLYLKASAPTTFPLP